MHTPEALASWSWPSVPPPTGDPLSNAVGIQFAVLHVLGRYRLGSEVTRLIVSLRNDDPQKNSGRVAFRGEFSVEGRSLKENAARIIAEVRAATGARPEAVADVVLACAGTWTDGQGERHRAEPLTTLRTRVSARGAVTSLAVYGDMWLPCDLAGTPQPALHHAHAPRLAAALAETAALLRSATRPGPATRYAEPTAAGAVNLLTRDGRARDVRPQAEEPPVSVLTGTGARLSDESPLYVPAHPQRPLPGAENQRTDLVFELLEGPEGAVAVAFSSQELLVKRMGTAQPWAAVPARTFVTLMARIGADPVYVDPPADPSARRWSAEDIAQYAQHERSND